MMGVCNLLILLFVNQLIGLYSGLSPETWPWRGVWWLLCSFAILMWPVAFVLPSALRAANDVKFTMWVGVGSMLVFRVFGSWLLRADGDGSDGRVDCDDSRLGLPHRFLPAADDFRKMEEQVPADVNRYDKLSAACFCSADGVV